MKTAAENQGELHQKLFPEHRVFIHPKISICLNCYWFRGNWTRKAMREYRVFLRKERLNKPARVM